MRHFSAAALVAACLGAGIGSSAAESQPIEAFARLPQIRNVTISPDGARVAFHDRKSDRVTLLTEIEKFLQENLGPGVAAGS